MTPKLRTILLFGAPGVGKGTQGRALGQLPGFLHFSSGDCFRALDERSDDGRQVAQYLARGELVPDELTMQVWRRAMQEFIDQGRFRPETDLLILDGIPRNLRQAELLHDSVQVVRIVHLVASDEDAMVERIRQRALKENRSDDADERVIRHRFEVYRARSEPVLGFYPKELICRVEALSRPAEVLRDVLDCVIPVL